MRSHPNEPTERLELDDDAHFERVEGVGCKLGGCSPRSAWQRSTALVTVALPSRQSVS